MERSNSCSDIIHDAHNLLYRENRAKPVSSLINYFGDDNRSKDLKRRHISSADGSDMNEIMMKELDWMMVKLEKLDAIESTLNNLEDSVTGINKRCDFLEAENEKRKNENLFLSNENAELRKEILILKNISLDHQSFLEKLDGDKRAMKLIITGVDDRTPLNDKHSDIEKCIHIFDKIGVKVKDEDMTMMRLIKKDKSSTMSHGSGSASGTSLYGSGIPPAPILVTFKNSELRKRILKDSKVLKEKGVEYSKIFIKKDTHPIVRKEWGRLYSVLDEEKKKPANIDAKIEFDQKNRIITRNGIKIDSWQAFLC